VTRRRQISAEAVGRAAALSPPRCRPMLRGTLLVGPYDLAMDLYAVLLGGPVAEGRMGEDHEVVFVVADSPPEARTLAKAKWTGVGRGHVDAVQRIEAVDGCSVTVTPTAGLTGDRIELQSDN
jgi:Domain of Unknown Function (DUF1543)